MENQEQYNTTNKVAWPCTKHKKKKTKIANQVQKNHKALKEKK